MKNIKIGIMFFAAFFLQTFIVAQSIDEGKKFMYYERYQKCKRIFRKLLAANPNNVDAAYWLGQAYDCTG